MKKNKLIVGAVALGLGIASFGAGVDAKGKPDTPGAGGKCVQAGIATLRSLDAFGLAAKGLVDYSAFAGDDGIRLDLAPGSNLSLGAVVSLHATSPQTFAWCD